MPKPILNPFQKSPNVISQIAAKPPSALAVLDAWMIDNPMLMTQNLSIHLKREIAERLIVETFAFRSLMTKEQQRDFNVSKLVEIVFAHLLGDDNSGNRNGDLLIDRDDSSLLKSLVEQWKIKGIKTEQISGQSVEKS